MKYVVFLGDGMADRPLKELDGRTPLGYAKHPNMDFMAKNGTYGLVRTVPEGMIPGSDTANLSVFGYDPKVYYSGRSPLEAASIGVPLADTDVTYRCNFVTLTGSNNIEEAIMTDYSAGEITSAESAQLVEFINQRFESETRKLYAGVSYRHCFVMKNAETGAETTPPHDISLKKVSGHLPTGTNAELLMEMMRYAYANLKDHPVNQKRIAEGKNPANAIWFWGEGRKPRLTPFFERFGLTGTVVSAVDLIQGIGICAGLDAPKIPGATGLYTTNFANKGQAAIDAFKSGKDFVYIHVEAPDECGHHAQIKEKVYSIEEIDSKIVGPVLAYLEGCGEDFAALVMPDHPTPIALMTHTTDPIPFALYFKGDHAGRDCRYNEAEAAKTGVFIPQACRILPYMVDRKKTEKTRLIVK